MLLSQPERRKLARLPLKLFVRLRFPGADGSAYAETRDVSAQGVYFVSSWLPEIGQEVECVLVFPEEITQAEAPMLVACAGRVLRLEQLGHGSNGIAVEISSYDFTGESQFRTAVNNAWH